MSQSQMQEITCPKGGKKQFFRVWDSINTMEDPPLKEAVRNDEAFSFHCVDCGASAALHYNFIYHEPAEKLFIVCSADGSDYTAMKKRSRRRTTPLKATRNASSCLTMHSKKNY